MDAGSMDRRVGFLKRRLKQEPGGEQREVFEPGPALWAKVQPLSGREFFQVAEVYQEETQHFIMRYRTDLDVRDRLEYRGRQYNIVHIAEIGRRDGLDVLAVSAPH